jgi:hypothetical protein
MQIVATTMTIADYCDAMKRQDIIVNPTYQRSDKVWPAMARSYLLETILTGYPVPKLSHYQRTDLASRKTFKEIVDGQQRSVAIFDFFNDDLRLSKKLETKEIAGRKYSDLTEDFQQQFVSYALTIDLFVAATPGQVVEVFRRMNSYTVPLNAEEQRHASYQGAFKWFINRLAGRFKGVFLVAGLFGEKQLVRMADTKLLTEITHAGLNGISTTDKKALDGLYSSRDTHFPEESDWESRLTDAFDTLLEWKELHNTALMKHYHVYSLVLALMHVRKQIPRLQRLFTSASQRRVDKQNAISNLTTLLSALETSEPLARYEPFVAASEEQTNVKRQREVRFRWYCKALTAESI